MSIHKLHPDRAAHEPGAVAIGLTFQHELYDLADAVLKTRAIRTLENVAHLLLARSSGNHDLHRFLAIADGVVRAQGRKIIFTTNLPNVSDLDDALLRPGRCFAHVRTRALSASEAATLAGRLAPKHAASSAPLLEELGGESMTVAELYRAYGRVSGLSV